MLEYHVNGDVSTLCPFVLVEERNVVHLNVCYGYSYRRVWCLQRFVSAEVIEECETINHTQVLPDGFYVGQGRKD